MKKSLYLFAAAALLIAATLIAKPLDTFTADNGYAGSLGTVTINTASGPEYLGVTGQGQFQTGVSSAVLNVVVNGQTVPVNQTVIVVLPNSDRVNVSWSSSLTITVVAEDM